MENPRQAAEASETVQQRIGRRLRQERLRHNLSQEELAEQVEVNVRTVRRWERGAILPQPHYREQLCQLFHLTAPFLFELESEQESPPPEKRSVWSLPFPRNPHFTGRNELLSQLAQYFAEEKASEQRAINRVALTQPQAIKGLGGIGKTQIAVEYAYRARAQGRYTHVLWINAASEGAIITSFMAIAELLPTFPEQKQTDQMKLVAAIKRWLEQHQEPWLLVFDNADDLTLTQQYFPTMGHGSILLTTRANAVGALAVSVEVEKMGLVEGTQLLLQRAQRLHATDEEHNEAMNVVIALDSFPLALDQAGAYIEETGCRFSTYLQLYQDHRQALLARRGTQATSYPDSVATTWALSLQKIEQANPAAIELLRLCAFLAPDHIPEELLKEGGPHWPSVLQQAAGDLFTFNQMLEALLTFSLLKRRVEDSTLSIHRLVQAVLMDTMEGEGQRRWAECVVRTVNHIFPQRIELETTRDCQRFLPQAQTCSLLIQVYALGIKEAPALLQRTARYLRLAGLQEQSKALFLLALPLYEQIFGPDHPDTAVVLHHLGLLHGLQGNFAQAEQLFQQALHIWETSEPENPERARVLHDWGENLGQQGKYEQAEQLFQQVLRLWKQTTGVKHPEAALTLDGLAILFAKQSKYEQAEPLFLRALAIHEQYFGMEHPQTAISLNNLTELYQELGKYEQAEVLGLRALGIWERTLGPEHRNLAYLLDGLAKVFTHQGKDGQAQHMFQRALAIWERTGGTQNPEMVDTLHNFAAFQEAHGNFADALPLYQRALAIREKVFGYDHQDTVETRKRYCTLLRAIGREDEAGQIEILSIEQEQRR